MDDVYERLADFLDRLPAGYPKTEDGREVDLLRRLFSPDEAELFQQLTLIAEPARVIARRVERPADELAEQLESMARKGLVYSIHPSEGEPKYMAIQFAVGIFEFQVGRLDREMAGETSAYMDTVPPTFWERMPQLRTIPVGESIPVESTVMIYEQAENLVRAQEKIAGQSLHLPQAEETSGRGGGCDKPLESCLAFGSGADYYERLGVGRAVDQEEALSILAQAEEAGLVLQPSNTQKATFICCCCGDCCEVLAIAKRHPRPAEILVSPFRAVVDEVLCSACGDCEFRCQMDAIGVDNGYAVVNHGRCIGCGLCVTDCPDEAVTLVRKPEEEQLPVPRNTAIQYIGALRSRGMASTGDMVRMGVRSKVDRFLARS